MKRKSTLALIVIIWSNYFAKKRMKFTQKQSVTDSAKKPFRVSSLHDVDVIESLGTLACMLGFLHFIPMH